MVSVMVALTVHHQVLTMLLLRIITSLAVSITIVLLLLLYTLLLACNLTCSAGYTAKSDCTDCDFTSICDRDSPCMNGGQCIQYSPATNYTCNCTGSYTGYNCSGIYRNLILRTKQSLY